MSPLRILLIEDDPLISVLMAEMLNGMAYRVCGIEATEAGAVRAALTLRPDLMIVDIQLRKGSGVAAVAKIEETTTIPCVFMTGNRVHGLAASMIVLQKPFVDEALVQAIDRAMEPMRAEGDPQFMKRH